LFIIASILAAIGLVVMLFMLPKPKTNNTVKHETITETSSSKESSKKNDDKKNQTSKKDDKKKDDTGKKEDTSTTSETPVTPTTGTTNSETENNNSSSVNTSSTNTTPAAPEPQPIYQTIHHDEVGHWETQVIQEAYDIPVYERKIIGNQTGRIYNSLAEFDNQREDGSYHVGDVQVGTTHHDAVTQEVWVVDQAAWDQTVIVGYR
ncbi:MAG: hypothetical protein HXL53_05150, partial [Solobacterium sp.]|nr:hypothetical protein [Solobacterium sp.]